jgi:excisionase family DNA binding protein
VTRLLGPDCRQYVGKVKKEARVSDSGRDQMLSPSELQEWLGCGRSMTYKLLATGAIPSYKVGRRLIRIRHSDVIAFLEENRYHPGERR